MKIGILTHYTVNNQGAQLQLAAMCEFLQQLGHTPVVLTYEKNFDFDRGEQKKNSGSFFALPYYVKNYLLDKGPGLTCFNIRKVLKHRAALRQYDFLPYDTDAVDVIIIGSDEVFSIDVGCNRMMYGYGLKVPAIAYAPAFGRTTEDTLRNFNCYDLVAEGLNAMAYLSARDVHTQQMILSLTGRKVPLVCDPVLLYDGSAFRTEVKPINKPYMVVYSYDRNMILPEEINGIKAYAKENGLLTVSLGTYHAWCDRNIVCNALEWYAYFKDAACVVTDTFHGAVVGMKNHCNLVVYVRENINKFKLLSLLEETGLSYRRLPDLSKASLENITSMPIAYEETDRRIETMIKRSGTYLEEALQGIHGQ